MAFIQKLLQQAAHSGSDGEDGARAQATCRQNETQTHIESCFSFACTTPRLKISQPARTHRQRDRVPHRRPGFCTWVSQRHLVHRKEESRPRPRRRVITSRHGKRGSADFSVSFQTSGLNMVEG